MLKGFHLVLYIGSNPAPRDVIEALTSAQITQTAGQRSGFQLVFSLSKRSRLQRELLPDGYFDPLTRVQLVVVLAGTPRVVFDGLVARQDVSASSDPGASTLTITGDDVSLAMDLVNLTGLPYPAMPNEARVALVLAKYAFLGVIPEIIPSAFVAVPNPLETIPMQIGTDLAYIRALAEKVGYVFYVTPGPQRGINVAYWGPEIRWGEVQPALSVNMDAHTNVDSLSFSYNGTQAVLYTAMARVPNTTVSIPVPIPNVGVLRPPLVKKQPIPFKFERVPESNRLGFIGAAAIGLAKTARASDAVTGSGTLDVLRYGRVLEPRKLVDVRGAGRTYDGTYYVKSVTHNIKPGEYKQSFTLMREGVLPISSRVAV